MLQFIVIYPRIQTFVTLSLNFLLLYIHQIQLIFYRKHPSQYIKKVYLQFQGTITSEKVEKLNILNKQIYFKHYIKVKIMEESLLKGSKSDQSYNPFESPPNLQKAEDHRKAMSLGKEKDDDQNQRICPCCQNVINKQQIPLNCSDEDLLFLGVGYSLFYKLTRYFGLLIFIIFMISGSGFYFLVTLNCTDNCVYFFGIPIINLEISGEDSAHLTDVVNVITAFTIFGCVLYMKTKIRTDIQTLQKKHISPDQYTLILQNLPQNINQQEDIKQWCKQKFQVKPVSVNFAYNVNQLSNAYNNRQNLTIKMNKILIQKDSYRQQTSIDRDPSILMDGQIKNLRQQIQGLDNLIEQYRQQKVVCHKIGTVFVTFSQQRIVVDILNDYENSLFKVIVNKLLSPFRNPPLIFRGSNVVVNRAPQPKQVIWRNLSYSFLRSVVAQIFFVLIMVLVLFFTFRIQYRIVEFAYKLRHEGTQSGQTIVIIEALAMSIVVVIVNSLLRLLIKLFAYFKQYYSYSSYHSAFCFYYSISYIFNTCFMIYIVHGHRNFGTLRPYEQQNILIYDIHLIMLANAFSQPLFKIFDPQMWFRLAKKRYIGRIPMNKNPYTQSYVNRIWEGYQIQIADNYQYIFRVLVITTWFAHSAPFGVVLSIIGLFFDYWIGKYLLLRHYKRPQSISKSIAMPMINSLELLPLVYICGVLQFTYKVSDSQNIFTFMYQFLKYGVTTFVIMICILGYLVIYKPYQNAVNPIKYQQVQHLFPYNYETQNPITKFKGQMKYLYGVLKRTNNTKDSKIIKQLLDLNLQKKDSYIDNQSAILKIKRQNLRRLQTMQMSQQYTRQKKNKHNKNSTSSDTSNEKLDF